MFEFTRREQIGALVLAGLLVVGIIIRFTVLATPPGELFIEDPAQVEAETENGETEPVTIVVHVAGAVTRPGVYSLPEGARVLDAVEAAGGSLPEGDPHALNLAEPLYDGRRITVPLAGESGGSGEADTTSGKVNINTATAAEFEKLPGIGPAKAAAIFGHREKNGPFASVDDLVEVPGIGPKTLESLKEYITLY